jgi:hypothetical protein
MDDRSPGQQWKESRAKRGGRRMVNSKTRTQTQFVVLPPSNRLAAPSNFQNLHLDSRRYDQLFAEMQRFRGRIYSADGAISTEELTLDGRHCLAVDEEAWNILSLNTHGEIVACVRCLDRWDATGFDDLWIRHAALTKCPTLGRRFRHGVEREMTRARDMGVGFSEVGGWAVSEDHRWTMEAVRIILAAYATGELLGGRCGVAMATFRHSSAMILRRIGLSSLMADEKELAPYYDPYYRCQMEILRFDSRRPNPKYRDWVSEISDSLGSAPVICRERLVPSLEFVPRGFDLHNDPALIPVAI